MTKHNDNRIFTIISNCKHCNGEEWTVIKNNLVPHIRHKLYGINMIYLIIRYIILTYDHND